MSKSPEIERLMGLAYELLHQGSTDDAEAAFRAVSEIAPDWSVPWYELGLICKYEGRWRESLEYNTRAAELDSGDEAAWWNMGIAATAVGDWAAARRAWAACGIDLPAGEGAPEVDYGLVPLRIRPTDQGEVVWAHRIDPARARIANVPFPSTEYRWRDLVLHDGAPDGYRLLEGREVPVFNVLERIERSGFRTYVLELGSSDEGNIEDLRTLAEHLGGAVENWGTSSVILCEQCSRGVPHQHVDKRGPPAHPNCGLAAHDDEHAQGIIQEWLDASPGADLVRWYSAGDAV